MVTLRLHKAQDTGDQLVDSLTLVLDDPIPSMKQPEEYRGAFGTEGTMLARLLSEHLPGGTLDAMLGELLRRKASLFVVPYGKAGE